MPSETLATTCSFPPTPKSSSKACSNRATVLSKDRSAKRRAILGPQRYTTCVHYEVKAINYRNGAMYQSVITPEGDKPWMDLPREGAYLRRCREAVPGVTAVCKQGRHAHYNVFISMKKMSEGDPARAAAAA